MTSQTDWTLLLTSADELLNLAAPTPAMQAYAIRRRPYLLFSFTKWSINTEYVCPGITAWAGKYRDLYSGKVPGGMMAAAMLMSQSAADWESVRRVAFMPPALVPRKLRKHVERAEFRKARPKLDSLSDLYWKAVNYPEVDHTLCLDQRPNCPFTVRPIDQ